MGHQNSQASPPEARASRQW